MKLLAAILFPISLSAQFKYCDKDTVINLSTLPNHSYLWNIDGVISSEQTAELIINRTGNFTVEVTVSNGFGCTSTSKEIIEVGECEYWTYYAPNAFTPSGVNKTWIPVGDNITIDLIRIFTREGQLIYEGVTEWDGGDYMGAVYVYTCDYTTITGQKIRDLGRVTIVR